MDLSRAVIEQEYWRVRAEHERFRYIYINNPTQEVLNGVISWRDKELLWARRLCDANVKVKTLGYYKSKY